MKRVYKCVNLKFETDEMLTELCSFLKTKKVPFLEELLTKLYQYFHLFKPREGWKLDYDIEVTRSRLIIEFSGFPSVIVAGMACSDEEASKEAKEQFKLRGLE